MSNKEQKIMFMKDPRSQRMFMDCSDAFNWLELNSSKVVMNKLRKKMEGAQKSIEAELKKKKKDELEDIAEWTAGPVKEPKKKWWQIL